MKKTARQDKKAKRMIPEKNERIVFYFCLLLFVAFSIFDIFNDLSFSGTIIEWDEARHGINAYEMMRSGNFIVNTYQYAPDYWNVKPPLSMWQIALAYKLFGYNTFALRFFSALYLPIIVVTSMLVLKRYIGTVCSVVTGFLFATTGSRFFHLFKSGDPDALFFFLCYSACIFLYIAHKEKPHFLTGTGICTALAFLTKGMHVISLFCVIAACLALTYKKRIFSIKETAGYLFAPMAAPVAVWGILRARYDGMTFFIKMFVLDVLKRVTGVVENHTGDPLFYIRILRRALGAPIFWGIVILLLLGLLVKKFSRKDVRTDPVFVLIFGTMFLAPLILFTISITKIAWYIFPCMIGVYFITGYVAQQIVAHYDAKTGITGLFSLSICFLILLIGGCVKPFQANINLLTTNVTSLGDPFSQVQATPGSSFFIVDSQGARSDILHSWLLRAYYLGLEYVPHDMNSYVNFPNALVILKHFDDSQLKDFCLAYPELKIVASASDYTEARYTALQ